MLTSELSINRRQVTTEKEVLIEWGKSVIRGRSLRILLQGNLLSSQDADSPWGPLDELELYHVDEIDIQLPAGGLWADIDIGRFKDQPELRKLPARLTATSGGRFSFDFQNSMATLRKGVKLVHQLGALPPDEFLCDNMHLKVKPPSRNSFSNSESRSIEIHSLDAFGVDSLKDFVGEKWVEVLAPTLELSARAKTLQLNLANRRVVMAGQLDQPGSTKSTVKAQLCGSCFSITKDRISSSTGRLC